RRAVTELAVAVVAPTDDCALREHSAGVLATDGDVGRHGQRPVDSHDRQWARFEGAHRPRPELAELVGAQQLTAPLHSRVLVCVFPAAIWTTSMSSSTKTGMLLLTVSRCRAVPRHCRPSIVPLRHPRARRRAPSDSRSERREPGRDWSRRWVVTRRAVAK